MQLHAGQSSEVLTRQSRKNQFEVTNGTSGVADDVEPLLETVDEGRVADEVLQPLLLTLFQFVILGLKIRKRWFYIAI